MNVTADSSAAQKFEGAEISHSNGFAHAFSTYCLSVNGVMLHEAHGRVACFVAFAEFVDYIFTTYLSCPCMRGVTASITCDVVSVSVPGLH